MVNESENTPQASTLADEDQMADPSNNDSQEDISLGDFNDVTSLSSLKAIRSGNENASGNEQANRCLLYTSRCV